MKRRSFIQNLVVGAAALSASMLPYGLSRLLAPSVEPRKRNILRPPGALKNAADFIEACIGCGLCGEVCPPRCIKFHNRVGGAAVNTPYIDAAEKACILCNKCIDACPTNALSQTPLDNIDMGIAEIDQTACYPWVDRGICGACVSICPLGEKAIGFKMWNQYRPRVREGCVGCGLCVQVCPHPSKPIWIVERPQERGVDHVG